MATKDLEPEMVVIVDLDNGNQVVDVHGKSMEDRSIAEGLISDRYNAVSGLKAINIGRKSRFSQPAIGSTYPV